VRRFGVLYVAALFWGCRDRSEAVATFVAVLELCKAGDVTLAGEEEEMTISCQGAPVALVSEEADDGNS
jgi:segregation and condensation protein A